MKWGNVRFPRKSIISMWHSGVNSSCTLYVTCWNLLFLNEKDGWEGRLEVVIRTHSWNCSSNWSGKFSLCQGNVRKFKKRSTVGVFWYQSSTTLFLPVFLFKHVTSLLILRTYLHGKSAIVILTTTRFHRMTHWSNLVTIQLISRQRYLH